MTISGDIIRVPDSDEEFIVVEVEGPYEDTTQFGTVIRNFAVYRRPDDLDGIQLKAIDETLVTVVGHASEVPGWTEYRPGMWRKVDA